MKGGSVEEGAWTERSGEEESNAPSHPATKAASKRPRHTRKRGQKAREEERTGRRETGNNEKPPSQQARERRKIEKK